MLDDLFTTITIFSCMVGAGRVFFGNDALASTFAFEMLEANQLDGLKQIRLVCVLLEHFFTERESGLGQDGYKYV